MWHFAYETGNLKQWADGFLSYEQISGPAREKGSISIHTYQVGAIMYLVTEETLEVVPYKQLKLLQQRSREICEVELFFEEKSGNETFVRMTYDFKLRFPEKILYTLLWPYSKIKTRKILEKMKVLVENEF